MKNLKTIFKKKLINKIKVSLSRSNQPDEMGSAEI